MSNPNSHPPPRPSTVSAGERGIKSLPFDITCRIVSYLPTDASVCLALTSHHYHTLLTQQIFHAPLKDICIAPQRCSHCQAHLTASHRNQHVAYFDLMSRLQADMGPGRKFCFQCERYVKGKNHFKVGRRKSCPWLKTVKLSKWDLIFQQTMDKFTWGNSGGAGAGGGSREKDGGRFVGVSSARYAALL